MLVPDKPPDCIDPLLLAGSEWVSKLVSGTATVADAEALRCWRAQSPEHEAAFVEAVRMRRILGQAAETFSGERRPAVLGRRALIGGALAAAGAGALVMHPPLGLWPSLGELSADFRTRKGERQNHTLADGSSVEMTTRTSIAVDGPAYADRVHLISGEAIFTVSGRAPDPLTVLAGNGRAVAGDARFNLRYVDNILRVTALDGEVRVEQEGGSVTLTPGHQTFSDGENLSPAVAVDPAVVTAWQRGLLIFRGIPLGKVVEEINRYRSQGRIIVTSAALAERPVNAIFRLNALDGVISQVEEMGARATRLPGEVVLLS